MEMEIKLQLQNIFQSDIIKIIYNSKNNQKQPWQFSIKIKLSNILIECDFYLLLL